MAVATATGCVLHETIMWLCLPEEELRVIPPPAHTFVLLGWARTETGPG
jgi:hypothetical protein